MNMIYDFPTTPSHLKKLADELANLTGYKRKSVYDDETELFENRFIAVEATTSASGWQLVLVKKNGEVKRLFPNIYPMGFLEFEYFLKGLVLGMKKGYKIGERLCVEKMENAIIAKETVNAEQSKEADKDEQ